MEKIFVPVLIPSAPEVTDYGGTATLKKQTQKAIAENLGELMVETKALDAAIDAAVAILEKVAKRKIKDQRLTLETFKFQMGISGSGSVGFLGTGVQARAQAVFEISFSVKAT